MSAEYDPILTFWLHELEQKDWYRQDDRIDQQIRKRFRADWETARNGGHSGWQRCAQGTLALLILTDQFPRNMFRGSGDAFATDALALGIAHRAIKLGQDLRITGAARQFFYLPYMHSEMQPDQERGVRQFMLKMPDSTDNLLHARAHRRVIRTFGRFPYRNDALGRQSTPAEQAYLDAGAYGYTLRQMQGAAA